MTEHPVIFPAWEVRAVLDGTKTQFRRLLAKQPTTDPLPRSQWECGPRRNPCPTHLFPFRSPGEDRAHYAYACPFGVAGDRLWVRESFTYISGNGLRLHYRADGEPVGRDGDVLPTAPGDPRWAGPIRMTRRQARLRLVVDEVRVQRVQEISEADARAEGVPPFFTRYDCFSQEQRICTGEYARDAPYRACFACVWDERFGNRALWSSNPWIWAVTFHRE